RAGEANSPPAFVSTTRRSVLPAERIDIGNTGLVYTLAARPETDCWQASLVCQARCAAVSRRNELSRGTAPEWTSQQTRFANQSAADTARRKPVGATDFPASL